MIGQLLRFLIAAMVLLTCAGASNEKIESAQRSLGASCCKSFQELPFKDLGKGTSLRLEVDVDAPVFDFAEGKSRFAAFRLAPDDRPTRLRIKTPIVGRPLPGAFVLYPAVTFLSAEFRRIQFVEPRLKYNQLGAWIAEVPVPAEASYAVIHTPTERVGTRIYYKEGVTTPLGSVAPSGKTTLYIPGNWWDVYLPAAGIGRLEIERQRVQ
jgi:hypothetical protein